MNTGDGDGVTSFQLSQFFYIMFFDTDTLIKQFIKLRTMLKTAQFFKRNLTDLRKIVLER